MYDYYTILVFLISLYNQYTIHRFRSKRSHERITRILTSLGQLGFPHLQAPCVLFLLHETLETGELSMVPFSTVKDWHHCIDNDFDANYVVDQFSRMTKKTKNDHASSTTADFVNERSNKQRMPGIVETSEPQQENGDMLYRFDSNNTQRVNDSGGDHGNKEKRLTYREGQEDNDVTNRTVDDRQESPDETVNSGANTPTPPGAGEYSPTDSPRQQDSGENVRNHSRTSLPDPVVDETSPYPQDYYNTRPRDNVQPPAYSVQDPY